MCTASKAQKKIYATFQLVYPARLTYDTLLVKDSEGNVISETSKVARNGKTSNTYLVNVGSISEGSFSIYFGGSSSAVNDTLYFLSRDRDLLVEVKDSFALRDRINFKLSNVYNFNTLYEKYRSYCNSLREKYYSLIKSNTNYKLSEEQFSLRAKFDFIKKNISNPYTVELFAVFVINPNSYVKYIDAYQFYIKNMKSNINDPKTRMFVESKIEKLKQSLDEGNKSPAFSARSIYNQLVNSDSLLGKNVLLIFWATWCEPCIKELPYLKQINEEYKGNNLVMISVSLDRDSIKMANMVSEKKLNWLKYFQ